MELVRLAAGRHRRKIAKYKISGKERILESRLSLDLLTEICWKRLFFGEVPSCARYARATRAFGRL